MAEQQKTRTKKILYAIFFISVFTLGTIIYVLPTVSDAFTRTYTIEYGGIQVSSQVECYVVRDENVYVSNRSGALQYYADEGKKLRKGAKVLDIVSGDAGNGETKYTKLLERMNGTGETLDSYVAKENGVVSYHIDGYEKVFTPENLETLTKAQIKKMDFGVENVTRNTTLKGEPLYKISYNNLWHIVCWVDEKEMIKFETGKQVSVALPLGEVTAKVDSISDDDGLWKVVLESNRYYENLSQIRKVDATIITEDYKGLVLPNESIASVKGQMGVYVKDIGGDFVFMPVKVITSDGEYSLVQEGFFYKENGAVKVETVDVYDEILRSGKL